MSETDTNEGRKRHLTRTQRRLEKYEGKVALAAEWENVAGGKRYYQKLMNEAQKLREALIVQGVLGGDYDL